MLKNRKANAIRVLWLVAVLVVFVVPTTGQSENEQVNLVRRLLEAFNNHDVPRMMDLLDDATE